MGEECEALAVQISVRGGPMAPRPPCRALGAVLDDTFTRVILRPVHLPTFKINNTECTCLLLWSAVEGRKEQDDLQNLGHINVEF